MVRAKFYKQLYDALSSHENFDEFDFKVENVISDDTDYFDFVITYNHFKDYWFKFSLSKYNSDNANGYRSVRGSYCPGEFLSLDNFLIRDVSNIYEILSIWQNNLWEELAMHPLLRRIEEHDKKIEDLIAKFDTMTDGHFSTFEENGLKNRLDELENQLKAEIEQRESETGKANDEIQKLHKDIENLKATISSFSKKGWFKNFTSKMFKWTKDSENRKMLKDGYNLITEFLPENIDGII